MHPPLVHRWEEKGRTLGKGYAIIKWGAIGNTLEKHIGELGEHHGKLIGNLENIPVCLRTKVLAQHVCIVCSGWLKGRAPLCTLGKDCNKKYNLTTAQCFWLAYRNDWSRWFAISTLFSLMGGVVKKYITNKLECGGVVKKYTTNQLECEKIFLHVTYWAPLEML
jgi:hypothetical protein